MITKESLIQWECNNIIRTYEFLKANESFLVGAQGEEFVISALSQLPDEYYVLNDVNLHFHRTIHWREWDEPIRNCQIDHIVVGPTGIFLVETKNWKASDIELKSYELIHQVLRSNHGLWHYIKDFYSWFKSPQIRNVIVSMKGSPSGKKLHKYIDVVTPHQLCVYITARKSVLSKDEIKKVVDIITHPRYRRPQF